MKTSEVIESGWYSIQGTLGVGTNSKHKFEAIVYVVNQRIVSGEWHRVFENKEDGTMHQIDPRFIGMHLSDYAECDPPDYFDDWEWMLK